MADFSIKKPLFGKYVEIILHDLDNDLALEVVEKAYEEGLRLQKIFNFYDENSELSKLNKKRKLRVSNELLYLIKTAKEFAILTNGEYDITLGKLFKQRKLGEPEQKLSCSYKDIGIRDNEIILNHPDIEIDLGSIAKGYIVDKIVESLKSQGVASGLVDGRGDIRIFGDYSQTIGIQHPRNKSIIKNINLKDCAVATSGDYAQYNRTYDKSHIIHKKDIISITVIAQTLMIADVFASVFFVSEKSKFEELVKKNKNIKIFTIDKNIKIRYYNNFEEVVL